MDLDKDQEAVAAPPPRNDQPLTGVSARLIADEIDIEGRPPRVTVALYPQQIGPTDRRTRPLWHLVRPRPGVLVSLNSSVDRVRAVWLTVEGASPDWNPGWVRWVTVGREVSELAGGSAVSAQDRLSEDRSALKLLLLPQEHREVTLEFDACLDEETKTGAYDFDVVVTDASDGTAATTPGQLVLRHPDATLLDMLPAIYHEAMAEMTDPNRPYDDPPFFTRYLRGYEDTIEPIRQKLQRLHEYFGVFSATPEMIPWLATWVGMALDDNWSEMKRRILICEAVQLYRWRGTRRGLSRYLEIYAGATPTINDQPVAGVRLGPNTLLGHGTVFGNVAPHTFVVTLAVPDPALVNPETVHRIIRMQAPAHTAYRLNIIRRSH
jgi:phage tail-like protein